AGEVGDVRASAVERLARDSDPAVRAAARRSRARLSARPRPPLRIVTFGSFQVLRGGAPVPERALRRRKARGLLAALACAGGAVHRETLVEWFWPELPADRGRAALHTTLHDLRRALEP